VLGGLLAAAGAGFAAGALVRPSGETLPVAPPPLAQGDEAAVELRERVEKLQVALDAVNRAPSRSLPLESEGPAPAPPAPVRGAGARLDESLLRKIAEQSREITQLKAEIELQKATLPEPQVLKDLRAAPLDEVIALATAIRKDVQDRLLTPPADLAARFSGFLQRPDSGTARILPRGKYVHVVQKREGGAYWSFVTKDNDYDKEPDLELQGKNFHSGFYGSSKGYFLELGDLDLDLAGSGPTPPAGLDADQRERWEFLWSDSPFVGAETWRQSAAPFEAFKERARSLKLADTVPAEVGRTYLLRSMLPEEHEVLVLFRVAGADETGMDLVWQVLKNWNIPRRR